MNEPFKDNQYAPDDEDRLIDRLVDGELRDADRRDLLLGLEAEPDGWRRCALAFLESQSWRQTFADPAALPFVRARHEETLRRAGPEPWRFRVIASLTGAAAGLAAAFALGWALHTGAPQIDSRASNDVEKGAIEPTVKAPEPAAAELTAKGSEQARPQAGSDRVERAVKQWEQQGYFAERQKKLVSVQLKDGRRVEVPIQEVRLQHGAGRTY